MDYQTLEVLRRMNPAWRLLTAARAPLIASFLQDAFIRPNIRTHLQSELASKLDDHLYKLRAQASDEAFPKSASEYLDDWASDEHGWLRKYYAGAVDEPSFDITPATEKALEWLAGLQARQFVGTASRMMTVFDLLRQLVERAQSDPGVRISELQKRKAEIDREIRDIQKGRMGLRAYFPTAQSLLMDEATLLTHRPLWVREERPFVGELPRLSEAERRLFEDLKLNRYGDHVRLEQERIAYGCLMTALRSLDL